MWDLPGPGVEPVFPALAGGFLTTAPPGKPFSLFCFVFFVLFCFKLGCLSLSLSYLCILDNSPLSDKCFANIYSQSMTCLFILLIVSFTEQKFLIIIKSNINFFLSWIMFLVLYLKTYCQTQSHLDYLLYFLLEIS